jgi:hypothetical protein
MGECFHVCMGVSVCVDVCVNDSKGEPCRLFLYPGLEVVEEDPLWRALGDQAIRSPLLRDRQIVNGIASLSALPLSYMNPLQAFILHDQPASQPRHLHSSVSNASPLPRGSIVRGRHSSARFFLFFL